MVSLSFLKLYAGYFQVCIESKKDRKDLQGIKSYLLIMSKVKPNRPQGTYVLKLTRIYLAIVSSDTLPWCQDVEAGTGEVNRFLARHDTAPNPSTAWRDIRVARWGGGGGGGSTTGCLRT